VTGRAVELQMRSVPWSTSGSAVAGRESSATAVAAVEGCWKGKAAQAQWYTTVVPPASPANSIYRCRAAAPGPQQEARQSTRGCRCIFPWFSIVEARRPGWHTLALKATLCSPFILSILSHPLGV